MKKYRSILTDISKHSFRKPWEVELPDLSRHVMIYGAGKMGEAALDMLAKKGFPVTAVVDRNEKLKGQTLLSIPILTPEDLTNEQKNESVFLVAMSVLPYYEVEEYLYSIGCSAVYAVGDFLAASYNEIINVWHFENDKEQDTASKNLPLWNDRESKRDYSRACGWFSYRREDLILETNISPDRRKYFPDFVLRTLHPHDSMLETALLDGAYARQFALAVPNYRNIYSCVLTPPSISEQQTNKLKKELEGLKILNVETGEMKTSCQIFRMGMMRPFTVERTTLIQTVPIDVIMKNQPFQYLRGYSLNPVTPIFKGALETIKIYRPILSFNISHYKDDFLYLPTLLNESLSGYSLYFRIHGYQGNDCIAYAIPKERE